MKTIIIEDKNKIDALGSIKAKTLALTGMGYSVSDIAGILNCSEGTVSYHRRKPEAAQALRVKKEIDGGALAREDMKGKVSMLTGAGYSVAEISKVLGVSEGTVSYHRRDPKNTEISLEKAEEELAYWAAKVAELKGE